MAAYVNPFNSSKAFPASPGRAALRPSSIDLDGAAMVLVQRQAEAEAAVGRHAFSDHLHSANRLRGAGVEPYHFTDEGWRLIFCGAVVCQERRRVTMVKTTAAAMQAAGLWDESSPADKWGPLWSLEGLCRLATSPASSWEVIE